MSKLRVGSVIEVNLWRGNDGYIKEKIVINRTYPLNIYNEYWADGISTSGRSMSIYSGDTNYRLLVP